MFFKFFIRISLSYTRADFYNWLLFIYVDKLDFYIHMSSHTVDLSVVPPSTVVCGFRGKPVRL